MDKCPQCGYTDAPKPKHAHMQMNEYVSADGKKTIVVNRIEDSFDVTTGEGKDATTTKWTLKSVYLKAQEAEAAAANQVPKTPPTTPPATKPPTT